MSNAEYLQSQNYRNGDRYQLQPDVQADQVRSDQGISDPAKNTKETTKHHTKEFRERSTQVTARSSQQKTPATEAAENLPESTEAKPVPDRRLIEKTKNKTKQKIGERNQKPETAAAKNSTNHTPTNVVSLSHRHVEPGPWANSATQLAWSSSAGAA
jgi:hypothetical protein